MSQSLPVDIGPLCDLRKLVADSIGVDKFMSLISVLIDNSWICHGMKISRAHPLGFDMLLQPTCRVLYECGKV